MNLLVTGATGFIGQALVSNISSSQKYKVHAVVRELSVDLPQTIMQIQHKNISSSSQWQEHLHDIDCVIHTAARVHVMVETTVNALEEFRKLNTHGSLNLAYQAAQAGVKRFIYISSIKVNGETTQEQSPFTVSDNFLPTDPYALSKYEAEQGLLKLARESKMQIVIIRPPLVYGPGVKANFLLLMKLLNKSLPLPFGAIRNKRSLLALDNLIDFILTCIHHPAAANQVFLVADGEDLSTSDLLLRISKSLGKNSYLLPIHHTLINAMLSMLGKKALAQRLCASLQIDISKTKTLLNWIPPITVDQGLKITAEHYLQSLNK